MIEDYKPNSSDKYQPTCFLTLAPKKKEKKKEEAQALLLK